LSLFLANEQEGMTFKLIPSLSAPILPNLSGFDLGHFQPHGHATDYTFPEIQEARLSRVMRKVWSMRSTLQTLSHPFHTTTSSASFMQMRRTQRSA
jgi:hypothetical protein